MAPPFKSQFIRKHPYYFCFYAWGQPHYYENQQKMLLKVLLLKSINNEILHIMSFFLALYPRSIG